MEDLKEAIRTIRSQRQSGHSWNGHFSTPGLRRLFSHSLSSKVNPKNNPGRNLAALGTFLGVHASGFTSVEDISAADTAIDIVSGCFLVARCGAPVAAK